MAVFDPTDAMRRNLYGREAVMGAPAEDAVVLTSGTTTFSANESLPDGLICLAAAVVNITTKEGTVLSSVSLPAGATIGLYFTSITVTSGTVLVYKP